MKMHTENSALLGPPIPPPSRWRAYHKWRLSTKCELLCLCIGFASFLLIVWPAVMMSGSYPLQCYPQQCDLEMVGNLCQVTLRSDPTVTCAYLPGACDIISAPALCYHTPIAIFGDNCHIVFVPNLCEGGPYSVFGIVWLSMGAIGVVIALGASCIAIITSSPELKHP